MQARLKVQLSEFIFRPYHVGGGGMPALGATAVLGVFPLSFLEPTKADAEPARGPVPAAVEGPP